ncbi:ABC transporter permease [Fodinicurvata sp. EGI_FJ10296]|uniref:ABC transporter permease n=1 Tax=Fodinicurvata sp. EGI_FJ10296 TaxID=3231908 RepID=UPI0034551A3D
MSPLAETVTRAVRAGLGGARSHRPQDRRSRGPHLFPVLTGGMLTAPILAGLAGTLVPSFGHLPAIGAVGPTLAPWRDLFADPAFPQAAVLSLTTGLAATLISFFLAIAIVCTAQVSGRLVRVQRVLGPLIALPHAALAVGLMFLLAPSGWLARLVSPWLTGWVMPPDLLIVNDPAGVALVLALVLKETPFLVLMMLAALSQIPSDRYVAIARSQGYRPATGWLKTVFPQIYPRIRLPLFAVVAFSLTVVDMAVVLGPTTPPTLAVLVVRWFSGADLSTRLTGAAGALTLCLMVAGVLVAWIMTERLARRSLTGMLSSGSRSVGAAATIAVGHGAGVWVVAMSGLAGLGLLVWSLAERWRYPDALPSAWRFSGWAETWPSLAGPALTTVIVAVSAAVIAIVLAVGCLETERRHGLKPGPGILWLVYAPLIVPQIGFLFGIQVLTAALGVTGTLAALVWVHVIFVLPYVFLTLAESWRRIDERYDRTAAALGAGPLRRLITITLPLMFRPLATAAAIGVAVSAALYLPTVFIGAGRLPTLATETVGMAAGGDRRLMALYAFVLMVVPWLAFSVALALPRIVYRNRKGMGG